MRIHNDGMTAAAASQAAPAENVAQPGSSTQAVPVATSGGDQVDISSLSGSVAASGVALAAQQAAHVSHLAALYAKGEYPVDSMQTSRALVSGAIASGPVEEDS